jgi:hypothetical protein
MDTRPSLPEVEAAARVLYAEGLEHGWWYKTLPARYELMDPIGKEEFEAFVERILMAARSVCQSGSQTT